MNADSSAVLALATVPTYNAYRDETGASAQTAHQLEDCDGIH